MKQGLSPWVNNTLDQIAKIGPGARLSVEELLQMNSALRIASGMEVDMRKAEYSGVNGIMQGTNFDSSSMNGSDYAPRIMPDIQPVVDNLTYTAADLPFTQLINKQGCRSPLVEYIQRESYGEENLTIFAGEGEVAPISKSKFRRRTIDIKIMMEVREYSDWANSIPLVGATNSAYASEVQDGALNFARKRERSFFWANSFNNPLAYDGIFTYIGAKNPGYVVDYRGGLPSPKEINGYNAFLCSAQTGNHARVTHNLCSQLTKQAYRNQGIPYTRTDGFQSSGRDLNYTLDTIRFQAGDDQVPLVSIPYMDHKQHPSVRAIGDKPPASLTGGLLPTVSMVASPSGFASAGGLNNWTLAETGSNWDYYYWFEWIGDKGNNISTIIGPITPATNTDVPRIDIADGSVDFDGENGAKEVEMYRAVVPAGGVAPTQAKDFWWVGTHKRNTANAGATRIYDYNEYLPETSQMLLIEISPRVMQFTELMDMHMRQLYREMRTTNPFAMVQFANFTMKQEFKAIWLKNVATSA